MKLLLRRLRKNRLTRSFSWRWFRPLDELTVNLFTSTSARRDTSGTALPRIARMSNSRISARVTAENPPFLKDRNPGEEVIADAAIRLQYRDDRQPAWPQPTGRVAV